jgi:hypothetical protein
VPRRAAAAGESAGAVAEFQPPLEVGRRPVDGAIDVEDRARHRVGEDAVETRRVRREPSSGVGVDRPIAVERGGFVGQVEHRHHRHQDPDGDAGSDRGVVPSGQQVGADVRSQLVERAALVGRLCEMASRLIDALPGGLRLRSREPEPEPGHAVALIVERGPSVVGGLAVTFRERAGVQPLAQHAHPLTEARRGETRQLDRSLVECGIGLTGRRHGVERVGELAGVRRRDVALAEERPGARRPGSERGRRVREDHDRVLSDREPHREVGDRRVARDREIDIGRFAVEDREHVRMPLRLGEHVGHRRHLGRGRPGGLPGGNLRLGEPPLDALAGIGPAPQSDGTLIGSGVRHALTEPRTADIRPRFRSDLARDRAFVTLS